MKTQFNSSLKLDRPQLFHGVSSRAAVRTLLPLLVLLLAVNTLFAAKITFTPPPTTKAGRSVCGNFSKDYCTTLAYFDAQALNAANGGIANLFRTAWNSWNASGGGQGWSLSDGGGLTGTINVTTAKAQQFNSVTLGGLTIQISVAGITLPTPGPGQQLVWVQGLDLNYTPGPGTILKSYYTMDTSTLSNLDCSKPTIFCPPAYPYQYANNMFYDQPKDFYFAPPGPQAFFDADAYLAIEDPRKKTLAVYDGVSYGFQNYVTPTPEPGTMVMFGSGIFGLAGLLHKRPVPRI
jgi:hypothetical protein